MGGMLFLSDPELPTILFTANDFKIALLVVAWITVLVMDVF